MTARVGARDRASGCVPLYSTAWTNHASRAVARKLGLVPYACDWDLVDEEMSREG